jgi:flagellar basal-body rod protein FlgB
MMFDALLQSTSVPVLEQVVRFAQARHTVLAGNIANLDTPGYQARDLSVEDFQERLGEAIQRRHAGPEALSPGEMTDPDEGNLAKVAEKTHTILRHDDSNVGMEQQVSEMVKNQMQHNLALSIMNSQIRLLQTAISERV